MMRASGTALITAVLVCLCCCSGALGKAQVTVQHSENDFKQDLLDLDLLGAIPILKDNGITTLSTFSALDEANFAEMNLKLGHRALLVKCWKSLNGDDQSAQACPAMHARRKIKHARRKVEHEKRKGSGAVKTRDHLSYPSLTARYPDWGAAEFAHCEQPYSWSELVRGYQDRNSSTFFKMGGLGRLRDDNGTETWLCLRDHHCATDPNDSWFCFVYHETTEVFTPWGKNSRLGLVEGRGDCVENPIPFSGCVCVEGYTGTDAATCVQCEAGKYKGVLGSSPCTPCPAGANSPAGAWNCTLCEAGKYKDVIGSSPCTPCPAGASSPAGALDCTCDVGYTGPNADSCVQCEAGKYKDVLGSSPCTPCAAGATSPAGAHVCTCEAGKKGPVGGPCKIPDSDCQTQPCLEYQTCTVERKAGMRNIDSQNYDLRNDDPQLRSTVMTTAEFDDLMSATFTRTDEVWLTRPVWTSPAAGGIRICWHNTEWVWNIMVGGRPCQTDKNARSGYVLRALIDERFILNYPDAANRDYGNFRCEFSV